jgi:hypothetical protein
MFGDSVVWSGRQIETPEIKTIYERALPLAHGACERTYPCGRKPSLHFHVHDVLRVRLRSVVDHDLTMDLPTRNVRHQRVVQQSNVALGP